MDKFLRNVLDKSSLTIDEVKNQSICRWVLLTDLVDDIYGGVEGGIITFIEDTKTKAGEKESELCSNGVETFLTCGALEPLSVGGVFVE